MKPSRPRLLGVVVPALVAFASAALGQTEIPLENWKVPLYNGIDVTKAPESGTSRHGIHALSDIGQGVIFQSVTPCRVVNTRNAIGPFGGPSIPASGSRDFALNANPSCPGIPAGVGAYSINVTAADTGGAGFLKLYPTGGTVPVVSTVNYSGPGQAVANAAIVPAGSGGAVTVVAGVSGANVLIDINGYFTSSMNVEQFLDVEGTYNPFLFGIPGGIAYFQNNTTSAGYSVNSSIASNANGSASLHGSASGTGAVYGVFGETASTAAGSAGVVGSGGGGFFTSGSFVNNGVRGMASAGSVATVGVLGEAVDRGVEGCRDTVASGVGTLVTCGVLGYAGTSGVHSFQDVTAGGTKPFVVPYAGKPEKQIVFVSTEADEVLTATRGRIKLQGNIGVIQLPAHYLSVTEPEGWTVQLTPVGGLSSMAVVRMDTEKGQIFIQGSRAGVDVFWRVEGIRKGYKDFQPVQNNIFFVPSSASSAMDPWPAETRQILIENKIYNADGMPNLETAKAMGWTKTWEAKQAAAKEAAATAAAKK